ncbi:FAD/NAD(P)-binding oxidoreductase [uncultured Microbacterium sp.]|uniref:NAD(P)/FAD-dependent oxidoreductase n=1 Tax=uncultured Microbacterium sp. TaxID=191216 RepID=UPI0028DB6D69|nr:FAD/NAD(P)-binding oxidoreductase [uncultured Microbacterium sp.]
MTSSSRADRCAVLIIGGGNAGISLAARLRRRGVRDIVVVEPRETHVYAPLQSHIAGGVAGRRQVVRSQARVTPRGVRWVQDRVVVVQPDEHAVELESGRRLVYGRLVVAAGIERRWEAVPGLQEARRTPHLVSNYTLPLAEKASLVLRDLRAGTVVFTQPAEPASCAGVAQKPMYLACDRWQSEGVLRDIRVIFVTPEKAPFHIAPVADELQRSLDRYGIETHFGASVAEVRPGERELDIVADGHTTTISYDVLHAAPPQTAASWIAAGGLGDADGFVDVDDETLRHRRWPDVWALGDAAPITTVRSGGAIRSQTKVVADGITDAKKPSRYDGYTETPFTVTRRTAVFAEFDRDGRLEPTIPFWKTLYRERRLTYVMDRWVLPWIYWNLILKGRA